MNSALKRPSAAKTFRSFSLFKTELIPRLSPVQVLPLHMMLPVIAVMVSVVRVRRHRRRSGSCKRRRAQRQRQREGSQHRCDPFHDCDLLCLPPPIEHEAEASWVQPIDEVHALLLTCFAVRQIWRGSTQPCEQSWCSSWLQSCSWLTASPPLSLSLPAGVEPWPRTRELQVTVPKQVFRECR